MSERAPVTDWTTDFDFLDPRYTADPYPIFRDMRASGCPVAHTKRFDGVSVPVTWEAVRAVAYNTEHFSSHRLFVRENRANAPPGGGIPPITSDPPQHRADRMPLVAPFSLPEAEKLRPRARATCNALIDRFIADRCFDGADDYAKHVPTRVIGFLLGLPEADDAKFHDWMHKLLENGTTDMSAVTSVLQEITLYFFNLLMARKKERQDDLVSHLLDAEFDGKKLTDAYIVGTIRLVLMAGVDTTWSAIGSAIWHLATHPADQQRLREEPALMTSAVEELLRAYAPVTTGRLVIEDTEIEGCPFKKDEMVFLSFPAANRDPARFPEPDRVILDREDNPHAAFGLGIHRCIGSHLARMEMTVALETLLARLPAFSVAPGREVGWAQGMIRGPRKLPLVF